MNRNNENYGTDDEADEILELTRDDFIRGMESAGLQLADRKNAPLEQIQANIEWAQRLPPDAIIKYSKKTGRPWRDLGSIRAEIADTD